MSWHVEFFGGEFDGLTGYVDIYEPWPEAWLWTRRAGDDPNMQGVDASGIPSGVVVSRYLREEMDSEAHAAKYRDIGQFRTGPRRTSEQARVPDRELVPA